MANAAAILVGMPELYRADRCTVCHHARTGDIDLDLVDGRTSIPKLARRWDVGERSLYRHRERCLPQRLADARAVAEVDALSPEQLVARVVEVERRAVELVDTATAGGDLRERAAALRELRQTVELLAKMSYAAAEAPRRDEVARPDLDRELEALVKVAALRSCPHCGHDLAHRIGGDGGVGSENHSQPAVAELEAGDAEVAEAELVE